jgi:hypothetical protein
MCKAASHQRCPGVPSLVPSARGFCPTRWDENTPYRLEPAFGQYKFEIISDIDADDCLGSLDVLCPAHHRILGC